MSEHIKTGAQIWKVLQDKIKDADKPITRMFDKEVFEQWVSLSWLKEQIQKEIDEESKKSTFEINHSYQAGLNNILSLLSQEDR